MTPISSLPPAVQDKVKMYQKEHDRMEFGEDKLESILWRNTDEGYDFWSYVHNGGWQSACKAFPTIAATFEQPTAPYQPQRGEMVEVQEDPDPRWWSGEYLMHEPRAEQPHVVLVNSSASGYDRVRPLLPELSLKQIAEKFGIPEDQVRIEGFTRNQKEVSHD